jgi:hypothetical protein
MKKNPDPNTKQPSRAELAYMVTEQFVVRNVLLDVATQEKITATTSEVDAQVEEFRAAVAKNSKDDFDMVIRDQLGFKDSKDEGFREFCTYFLIQKRLAKTLVTTDTVTAKNSCRPQKPKLPKKSSKPMVPTFWWLMRAMRQNQSLTNSTRVVTSAPWLRNILLTPAAKTKVVIWGGLAKVNLCPNSKKPCLMTSKWVNLTQVPVKTQYGFHVIKLFGQRRAEPMDLADIDSEIASRLPSTLNQRRSDEIAKLIDAKAQKSDRRKTHRSGSYRSCLDANR